MAFSKIILDGVTQIDLTQDTVVADKLYSSYTAHGADGEPITGTASGGGTAVLEVLAYYDELGGVWDWFLNKSFSDLADAGYQGKDIVIYTNDSVYVTADGWWNENAPLGTSYLYTVHLLTMDADNVNDLVTIEEWMYEVTSGGTTRLSYNKAYDPSLTDAVASDIRNGKKVISTTGFVTGTVPDRTSSDLTVSGATVTAPAGFYASNATKTIPSGTEGTPTATKGAVSNHSVSVTPSVTNAAGYISGGTHNGTAVTVTASELASGNKAINDNGTNIDVVGYSTVSVAVPFSTITVSSSNPTGGNNGDVWIKTS